jgi:hypothetical protein
MTSLTKAPPDQKPIWHTLSTDDALRDQGVAAATGLSQAEVSKRLQQYGTNRFAAAKKVRRDGQVIEVLAEGLVPGVRAYFGVVADHRA